MREKVECAECKRTTPAGPQCTLCGAPLTGPPIAGARWGCISALVVVGFALAAFAAWVLSLNVRAGTHPVSAPDYETPADVTLNVQLISPIIAVGLALVIWGVIWGIRRRRR
jgi:hypothetical protein